MLAVALAAIVLGRSQLAAWPNAAAEHALADHRYDAAATRLRFALAIAPNHPESHLLMARVLRKQERFDDAREHLRKAQSLRPFDERYREETWLLDAHQGRLEDAPPWESVLGNSSLDPGEVCAAYASGLVRRGRVQEAYRLLAAWQTHYPDDPQIPYLRGRLLIAQRWPGEAEAEFRLALQRAPHYAPAALALADLLASQHRLDEALTWYTRCDEATATRHDALLGAARCWRMLGRPSDARRLVGRVLDENPRSARAWCELGRLDIALGDYTAALQRLRKADRLAPGNEEIQYELAMALSGRGEKAEAARRFEELEQDRSAD